MAKITPTSLCLSFPPSSCPSSPGTETGASSHQSHWHLLAHSLCWQKQLLSEGPWGRLPSKKHPTFLFSLPLFLVSKPHSRACGAWIKRHTLNIPMCNRHFHWAAAIGIKNKTKPSLNPHSPLGPFLVRDACVQRPGDVPKALLRTFQHIKWRESLLAGSTVPGTTATYKVSLSRLVSTNHPLQNKESHNGKWTRGGGK